MSNKLHHMGINIHVATPELPYTTGRFVHVRTCTYMYMYMHKYM